MSELWLVDLEAAAPALEALERDRPCLSADDRARALRLSDARERRHRLAAYTALRVVLERAAGPEVRGARFLRGPAGKPRLHMRDTSFSLSHTEGLALIGVARASVIGVDLERTRVLRMSGARREQVLALGVGLAGEPAGDADPDTALLRAWCRLEAFAKARGQGIAHLLGEVGMRGAGGRQPSPASIEAAAHRLAARAGLGVADVALPAGLHGAVAARGLVQAHSPDRFPAEPRAIRRMLTPRPPPAAPRPR